MSNIKDFEIVDGVLVKYHGRDEHIEIPNNIKIIGDSAFSFKGIKSIVITEGVTSIGKNAFLYCFLLTDIKISNTVTRIDSYAFSNCLALKTVIIPSSVISVGLNIFNGCKMLKRIYIPHDIFAIYSSILDLSNVVIYCGGIKNCLEWGKISYDNTSISKIYYECKVIEYKKLGIVLFTSKNKLLTYSLINQINNGELEGKDINKQSSLTIPNFITDIGSYAFDGCDVLEEIIIPSSVKKMGDNVFKGCNNLTINCELKGKPFFSWNFKWNPDNRPVNWNYKK